MSDLGKEAEDVERQLISHMKTFQELIETKEWKAYAALLQNQINTRLAHLRTPTAQVQRGEPVDAMTRVLGLETVKGAIIGLELALNLPHVTISEAKNVLAERAAAAGKEVEDNE